MTQVSSVCSLFSKFYTDHSADWLIFLLMETNTDDGMNQPCGKTQEREEHHVQKQHVSVISKGIIL